MLKSTQMTQQQNDTLIGQEIQPKLQLEGGPRQLYWKVISDLKMPPNPTREEYKAVYDADMIYIKTQVFRLLRYYSPATRNIA